MELLEAFLLFIFAVIISSIIYNRFPKIPTAFIQIALGVCLFVLPIPMHFEFESEVFMMAVIAPLLFVEGTHISRTKLLEYRKPIVLYGNGTRLCYCYWCWFLYSLDLGGFTNASCLCNCCNSLPY